MAAKNRSQFNLQNRRSTDAPLSLTGTTTLHALVREGLSLASAMRKNKSSQNAPVPLIPAYVNFATVEALLNRNKVNRKVMPHAAADYLCVMDSGAWIDFAPDPIMINTSGNLTNGQNRLLAAYMYLKANPTKVLGFNFQIGTLDSDTRVSVDHGRTRTAADHLRLLGIQADGRSLRAAMFPPNRPEIRTDGETLKSFYNLYKKEHDLVLSEIAKYPGVQLRLMKKTGCVGALIRAAAHVTEADIKRFLELLLSKPGAVSAVAAHEKAVLQFREKVLTFTGGGRTARYDAFKSTVGAIDRFCRRVQNTVHLKKVGTDIYPLKPDAAVVVDALILNMSKAKSRTAVDKIKEISPNFANL